MWNLLFDTDLYKKSNNFFNVSNWHTNMRLLDSGLKKKILHSPSSEKTEDKKKKKKDRQAEKFNW